MSCCAENSLLKIVKHLRATKQETSANQLEKLTKDLSRTWKYAADTEPRSKYIANAPQRLDRYYESCFNKYQDRKKCERIAWNIFCKHIMVNHPNCSK